MEPGEIIPIQPRNIGWIEKRLTKEELNYVWQAIENKDSQLFNKSLAGNISASYLLYDKNDFFFKNTLLPLCSEYEKTFGYIGKNYPIMGQHPYIMDHWWVNYQYQHEFNPLHVHKGLYSFVIWLKSPTDYEHQENVPIAKNSGGASNDNFTFYYTDALGNLTYTNYSLCKASEQMMLFFPSKLNHTVYPFYDNDGERISVSGNICLDTRS